MNDNTATEFISSVELMKLLNVSKVTVQRWVKSGKLQAEKHIGDRYLWFKRSEIESFIRPKVGRKPRHKGGN